MFKLPSLPNTLIGRKDELHRLFGKIGDDRRLPKIIGITGPAGIGKSSLGIQFLRDVSRRLNPIWLSAFDIREKVGLFEEILHTVKAGKDESLVLIDHAEPFDGDTERFGRQLLGIKRLRAVIVTSRQIERPIFDIDRLELSGLNPREGYQLLVHQMEELGAREISEAELRSLEAVTEGRPMSLMMIPVLLKQYSVEQVRRRFDGTLYDLEVQISASEERIIEVVAPKIVIANEELLYGLKRHPEQIHDISHRKFEELIAELLDDQGFKVELTQASKDGGKDIIAEMETEIGKILCLVEAKHYNPNRPVQVSLVRQLLGTYVDYGATSAMLVTSSHFTRGAKEFQARHEYRLTLKEYEDVVRWIKKYKTPKDPT